MTILRKITLGIIAIAIGIAIGFYCSYWNKLFSLIEPLIKTSPFLLAIAAFYTAYLNQEANRKIVEQSEEANKRMIKHQKDLERHKWINEFRLAVSEFLGAMTNTSNMLIELIMFYNDENRKNMLKAYSHLTAKEIKLRILLNNKTDEEKGLEQFLDEFVIWHNSIFSKIQNIFEGIDRNKQVDYLDKIAKKQAEYNEKITVISQKIITREWAKIINSDE